VVFISLGQSVDAASTLKGFSIGGIDVDYLLPQYLCDLCKVGTCDSKSQHFYVVILCNLFGLDYLADVNSAGADGRLGEGQNPTPGAPQ